MFRKKHFDIEYEASDTDSEGSWGLTVEQSLKQQREFLIRFTREEERKEPFGKIESEQLGLWLRGIWGGKSVKRCVQVVDVRDDDFNRDGHIVGSLHRPNEEFSAEALVKELEYVDVVVFHCYLSDERGPMCAREYCRLQKRVLPRQQVYLLEGGIRSFIKESTGDRDLMDLVKLSRRRRSETRRLFSESESEYDEKLDVDVRPRKRNYRIEDRDHYDITGSRDSPPVSNARDWSPQDIGRSTSYRDIDQDEVNPCLSNVKKREDRDQANYSDRDWIESYRDRGRHESSSFRDREKSSRGRESKKYISKRDRFRVMRTPSPPKSSKGTDRARYRRRSSPRRSPRNRDRYFEI